MDRSEYTTRIEVVLPLVPEGAKLLWRPELDAFAVVSGQPACVKPVPADSQKEVPNGQG